MWAPFATSDREEIRYAPDGPSKKPAALVAQGALLAPHERGNLHGCISAQPRFPYPNSCPVNNEFTEGGLQRLV
jgi:hypothetical protein